MNFTKGGQKDRNGRYIRLPEFSLFFCVCVGGGGGSVHDTGIFLVFGVIRKS